ncbi:cupin [Streptomyces boncukensis]|uniref:Cupin n=1 Tax=Streptomyces boncukensis TaxID=2711219 RepID=A0A6G4X8F1_9ACTN|nr:cupin [Streptomyces boncukensis]NGO73523.1 cupin [Streptomyces boncukensis]
MDDLTTLSDEHMALAAQDARGRSAHLFLQDGPLRQSVIALVSGAALDEHSAPPAASLHVLRGYVRVTSASGHQEVAAGQVQRIPQERHGVTAMEDSVLLLTTVTGTDTQAAAWE